MRWAVAVVTAGSLLAVAAGGGDAARRAQGVASTGCTDQSFAGVPRAYRNPENLVVGPLAFVTALSNASARPEDVEGGIKAPALLRPGHRARVSISPASRSNVRLAYGGAGRGRTQADFARFPHTIVFKACPRRRAGSRTGGRRVTFWSGFFVIRDAPTCIGVDISIDGRRARHRVIPISRPSCK